MSNAMRSKKTTGALVGIGVVFAVILLSRLLNFFNTMENKAYDLRCNLMVGPVGEQNIDDVVIVDIDDASLAQLGRFQNWPRLYHAKVADYLAQGGAKAITFDIYFTESDSLKPEMVDFFVQTKKENVDASLAQLPSLKISSNRTSEVISTVLNNWGYDKEFSEVAQAAGKVYFPLIFVTSGTGDTIGKADTSIIQHGFKFEPAISRIFSALDFQGNPINPDLLLPVSQLMSAAKGTGYYNIMPDIDGVTRRQMLFITYAGTSYPSLDLRIVMDALGVKQNEVTVEPGKFIRLGDKRTIPIDDDNWMRITYFGSFKKFRYISYADVLTENVPAEYFKNKIVLIGTSAAGLMDLRVVPFSNQFPGPEIHANIMETLLTGRFINALPEWVNLAILVITGLLTVFISLRFKPVNASLVLFGLVIIYFAAAIMLFNKALLWIEVVRPLTVILFTNMAILGYRYLTEEKQKVWIKNMFQGYMSKDLVDKIMANPEMLLMGGDKKEVTVFFSDIKGFSSFSEKLGTPERLIALINEYLGAMSDVVLEYGGYISKYEGDAIMAFWGAPTDDPKHAETAIKCVWAMNQRLQTLNADLAKRSMPNLFTRFGLNTGLVTVGNVGSEKKKSYTAMGDSINLGSRLEGANKEYGTAIMMSEFTYAKVQGLYPVRELDMLRVVGKEQPVRVYELLGISEADVSEKKKKAVEIYLKGLELYRSKQWDQAEAVFRQALEVDPDDGPSKTYIDRCEDFKVLPPPENWDGVFVMKTK